MRESSLKWHSRRRLLHQLHAVQRGRCFYCGTIISFFKLINDPQTATIDHFIPLDLGGEDDISNVVLACGPCNGKKSNRRPTLPELLKWNELADRWPQIQPLPLEVHARKECIRCGDPIAWERQLQAIRSGGGMHDLFPYLQ